MNRRPWTHVFWTSGMMCFCILCVLFSNDATNRGRVVKADGSGNPDRRSSCVGDKNERVAIVFYGLPRGLSHTHLSIKQNIFDVLQAHCIPFEVFFHHVVFLEPFSNPRNNELNVQLNNSEWRLLNPNVELSTEHGEFLSSQEQFTKSVLAYGDPHNNDGLSTRNELEALHSLKAAVLAARGKGKRMFGGLIILRPDLIYHDKFDVDLLLFAMSQHLVVLPAWQMWGGANDRFSFGAWEPMSEMGTRFDRILEYCKATNRSWHAESFVEWLLDNLHSRTRDAHGAGNKRFCHTTMRASRVRAHGVVKDEDFSYQAETFVGC